MSVNISWCIFQPVLRDFDKCFVAAQGSKHLQRLAQLCDCYCSLHSATGVRNNTPTHIGKNYSYQVCSTMSLQQLRPEFDEVLDYMYQKFMEIGNTPWTSCTCINPYFWIILVFHCAVSLISLPMTSTAWYTAFIRLEYEVVHVIAFTWAHTL